MPLKRRRRFAFVAAVAGVFLLPLAGWWYEGHARARDRSAFQPAGRLLVIGRRTVHVLCAGTGAPTVVFESSGFGNSISSPEARSRLSELTTVCSYDRMGTGWSDPGPSRISVGMLADDLSALTGNGSIDPPLVVVASSIGGLTAELFAREHPDSVDGLVLLDAATSETLPRVAPMIESSHIGMACSAVGIAGRIGLLRLLDPLGVRGSAQSDARSNALLYGAQPWDTLCAMVRGLPDTRREFEAADPLAPSIPVTALSAENTGKLAPPGFEAWAGPAKSALDHGLRALSTRSTHGAWRVVPGSDHLIAESAPQAVVDAVREMLQRDRRRDDRSTSRVH
jgi:pimeloyl-ACP methyl ester carboxylesterase